MKILFLDAYFEPEQTAFTHLESDLTEALIGEGHEIDVVCPVPTRGIDAQTRKKYGKIRYEEMYGGKLRVHRFYAPEEKKSAPARALRYLLCNFLTYAKGGKFRDTDVIFCNSTPPTQGFVAGKLKKALRCRLVYSLQDVFPDSMVTAGLARRDSVLWKIGRTIENSTYKRCDEIIVISETMRNNLIEKNVPEEKITVIPNWVDTEKIIPVERGCNRLYGETGTDPSKFIAVYAGNFGSAQGTDVIIKAAEILRDEPDVHFVLFGGGALFASAKESIRKKNLGNVTVNPLLPADRTAEVYSMGDAALITCRKGAGRCAMPSKTWSIMACGTPIIASFDTDSELASILEKSGGGICVEPEDGAKLAEAVINAKKNGTGVTRSRMYAEKYASKTVCVKQYTQIICAKRNDARQ